jgi:cysteinyl-tRNA synthetase
MSSLQLYNTYTRRTEAFVPLHKQHVGLYVCGPTVYGPPHMGHVRGPVVFDVLRRYLEFLGYKVRHVRNITDVGHLVGDGDEGEDKLSKQARLEQVEPMEVAQSYTVAYNEMCRMMNVLPPGIEPRASGHIIEQIEMIEAILNAGLAYEVNGSVYFDVLAYAKTQEYGKLSAFWRIWSPAPAMRPVNWKDRTKKETPTILRFGKKPLLNISCSGAAPGAKDIPVGTLSVLP